VRQDGAALVDFALAWPLMLLAVFACVQLAIWGAEEHAARSAALAGARAGSAAGAGTDAATEVTLNALGPSLFAIKAVAWCPGSAPAPPGVWVCSRNRPAGVSVDVGGSVPALVPLVGAGLPIAASASMGKEAFAR
jgi:hypothetical protein